MYYLMWGKIEKNYLLEHTIAESPTFLPNQRTTILPLTLRRQFDQMVITHHHFISNIISLLQH